jgi:glyoxylase-like metal-dependent hydrolase (beta-lactamase superfamily II)
LPEAGLLYAGDHLLETITPNIGWLPERDMLGEYLNSLTAVEPLSIRRVLPSHGAPFSGHAEWIRQTRRHHQERCDRIGQALGRGWKTAHELVPKVWERELSLFHYYFAVNEALAHLEHMRRLDVVRAERNEGGALNWSLNRELPANA